MDSHVDAPRQIRDGEELDLERLLPYLREHIPDLGAEVQVSQFPSGHSNLTYFLEDEHRGYVLRRPPHGAQVKSGHDMSREHNVLAALHPVFPKAPKPFVLCEDPEILGAPFYVMERVVGVILRRKLPDGLTFSEDQMAGTCDALVSTLAEIHAVDLEAAGLSDFGRPQGYVARQIEGWTRRWGKAKTDEISEIERAAAWLADNMPPERGATTALLNLPLTRWQPGTGCSGCASCPLMLKRLMGSGEYGVRCAPRLIVRMCLKSLIFNYEQVDRAACGRQLVGQRLQRSTTADHRGFSQPGRRRHNGDAR